MLGRGVIRPSEPAYYIVDCRISTHAVIFMRLCLCKILSQDCSHGEIRHCFFNETKVFLYQYNVISKRLKGNEMRRRVIYVFATPICLSARSKLGGVARRGAAVSLVSDRDWWHFESNK